MVVKDSLTDTEQNLLENHANMFPDNNWRKLIISEANPQDDLEHLLAYEYLRVLNRMRDQIFVKPIALDFQDADRTLYYLFLTTGNPDGALKLNEILDEARITQRTLKIYRKVDKEIIRRQTLLLFDLAEHELATQGDVKLTRGVNIPRLAEGIYEQWRGQSPRLSNVKGWLADSDVYAKDINSALRSLGKNERVSWDDQVLRNSTTLRFQ